jgi:hypothetical protein
MGWRDRISPKRAWREAIFATVFFYIVGIYLTLLSTHHIFFPWERSDFILYKGQLKSAPHFGSGKSSGLQFVLKADPSFIFSLDGDNYNALESRNEIFKLKTGDSVSFLVDRSQYEAKIAGKPSTFLQRTINWKQIRIFEINHNNRNLLSFSKVIQKLKNAGWGYLTIGLILLTGSSFYLKRELKIYRKKQSTQEPSKELKSIADSSNRKDC